MTDYINGKLTFAEETVLQFLRDNKGNPFRNDEIEELTGIRSDLVNSIVRSLRVKGYEVITDRRAGTHEYVHTSWKATVLLASMMMIILSIFFFGIMNYLGEEPEEWEIEEAFKVTE